MRVKLVKSLPVEDSLFKFLLVDLLQEEGLMHTFLSLYARLAYKPDEVEIYSESVGSYHPGLILPKGYKRPEVILLLNKTDIIQIEVKSYPYEYEENFYVGSYMGLTFHKPIYIFRYDEKEGYYSIEALSEVADNRTPESIIKYLRKCEEALPEFSTFKSKYLQAKLQTESSLVTPSKYLKVYDKIVSVRIDVKKQIIKLIDAHPQLLESKTLTISLDDIFKLLPRSRKERNKYNRLVEICKEIGLELVIVRQRSY